MKTKICTKCNRLKSLSGFYKGVCKDGYEGCCKACKKKLNAAYWEANRCAHGLQPHTCKKCGNASYNFVKGSFTKDEMMEMGAVSHCQFPSCSVEPNGKTLHSDHVHDGQKVNPENYRGEICHGHNTLMADLDRNPEWAKSYPGALEYMARRPYSRIGVFNGRNLSETGEQFSS